MVIYLINAGCDINKSQNMNKHSIKKSIIFSELERSNLAYILFKVFNISLVNTLVCFLRLDFFAESTKAVFLQL